MKRYIGIMLLAVMIVMSLQQPVQAASASISIETDTPTVKVGDTLTVRLVLQGTVRLGGFEAFLTYNPAALEFRGSDGPIAGGEGYLRISDQEPMERVKKRTYEITFEALAVGGSEVAIKDKAYIYEDDTGNEMSVSSNSLFVKVEATEEASDNARLGTLKVNPTGLVPEFAPETTRYELEVGSEIHSLVISAVPEDPGATVTVTGNQDFAEGENLVEITVKAENSDTQVYEIYVKKEKSILDEDALDKEQEISQTFQVKQAGEGFEIYGNYHYYVTEAPHAALEALPEEHELYLLEMNGMKIPAYKAVQGKGDATTEVLVYVEGRTLDAEEAGFYELRLEDGRMTRLRTVVREKEIEVIQEVDTENTQLLYLIIVVLAVICAFLGIGLIHAGGRRRRL